MFNFNLKSIDKKILTNIFFTVFLVSLLILAVVYRKDFIPKESHAELSKLIVDKMTECNQAGDLACFKNIAHEFVTKYNIKDVLSVFEENEKTPVFFANCHTTLHFVGQEEYKLVGDTAKALSAGTPICFAGFYHGVLEGYLSQSGLVDN